MLKQRDDYKPNVSCSGLSCSYLFRMFRAEFLASYPKALSSDACSNFATTKDIIIFILRLFSLMTIKERRMRERSARGGVILANTHHSVCCCWPGGRGKTAAIGL